MKNIFYFLIFPGFLFTAVVGLFLTWIDRKVTARIQWRIGPPWYQPFADFYKLLGKEVIVPKDGLRFLFLLAPCVGLAAITLVSTILLRTFFVPSEGFVGDLIVVLYFLTVPALSVIIGGFASSNPLASLGASREMKLMLSYEVPFIISIFVPVIISNGRIGLGELLTFQKTNSIFLTHPSAIIAFLAAIICMQAKLTLVPFDMPEAETEIIGGPYIEYSGSVLAMYKLTRAMALFVMPVFLVLMFCPKVGINGMSVFCNSIKVLGLVLATTLIRNTNPRMRIDQAIRFFWGPVTAAAMFAVLLAFLGF